MVGARAAARRLLLSASLLSTAHGLLQPSNGRLLQPTPRRALLKMQLSMPEDTGTVTALIQQTRDTAAVLVLHYSDPLADSQTSAWEDPPIWGDGSYSASQSLSPSDSIIAQVAVAYGSSAQNGGRPLTMLQIDRDVLPEICVANQIVVFPTTQIWSRGQCEVVAVGNLETRLLSLGVASQSSAASEQRSGAGGTIGVGPRAKAVGQAAREVDFFGVGTGGGQLTREGAASASSREPQLASGLPSPAEAADLADDELPPVEALGVEDQKPPGAGVDAALNVLFSEPSFDED